MSKSAGIPTLTIRTADFDRSVDFYRALLGEAVFEMDIRRDPRQDPPPHGFFSAGARATA